MKFHIRTYGCQMNVRDSEATGVLLEQRGHVRANGEEDADLVVVNTCSVRGKAEDKALGKLGLLASGKKDRPGRIVGVLGCMAQRLQEGVFAKVPDLDFAVGTHRLAGIPDVVARVVAGEKRVLEVGEDDRLSEDVSVHAEGVISAFVNILLGCDRRCTYCVVPTVRGSEWSRSAEGILLEVGDLAVGGCREVTLLGQSVMSFGRRNSVWKDDCVSPRGFVEPLPRLLEAVGAIDGIERVRFASGHPSGCTPELASAMSEVSEVCQHLHLPLQSGSDRILDRMRRGYTVDDYRQAAAILRSAVPRMALSTDIIVGFPSETEEEFEMTRRFCDEMKFDNSFIFKYSPRPGTVAAEWVDDVPADEKMRRNKVLLDDQDRRSLAANRALKGTRQEVLVQGVSPRNPSRWSGRSGTNRIIVFEPKEGVAPGDLVNVEIKQVWSQTLYGFLV